MKLSQLLTENRRYDLQTGLPPELSVGDAITNGPASPVFIVRGVDTENGETVYTAFSDRKYSMRGDEDGEDIDLKFTVRDGELIPRPAYKGVI